MARKRASGDEPQPDAGIQLFNGHPDDGDLKDQAMVTTPGTVSIQLFSGHPDDGDLKEEAEVK